MSKKSKKPHKRRSLRQVVSHIFHPQDSNNNRSRILHPEALVYLSLVVMGLFSFVHTLPSFFEGILGYATNITIDQVVEYTNNERASEGLSPVKYNRTLSQAALSKGQDMLTHQYWAHTSPSGKEPWDFIKESGYVYTVAGENLARDFMDTEEMTSAWMASPTHRANIMNPKFEEIGIAVIDGKLKGFETTLVVQMFGASSEKPAEITADAATADDSMRRVAAGLESDSDEVLKLSESIPTTELGLADIRSNSVFILGEELHITQPALFTPLQMTKALFLAVVLLLIVTLIYDAFISHYKKLDRKVGKNIAHIIMLCTVAFLVIFFKGGFIQ